MFLHVINSKVGIGMHSNQQGEFWLNYVIIHSRIMSIHIKQGENLVFLPETQVC